METPEKEQSVMLENQDTSMILEDPELARLALYLRQTPSAIIDFLYRDSFSSMMSETGLAQQEWKHHDEIEDEDTPPKVYSEQDILSVHTQKLFDELKMKKREDATRLTLLALRQRQVAPDIPIDPVFQEALQEKLLQIVRNSTDTASTERSRREALALKQENTP